jgi:putative flippase GtrA
MTIKNKRLKLRFMAVGAFNTTIDFGLLFSLKALGFPEIPSNIVSSTTAFVISFFLNKKVTFKTTDTDVKREIILFIVITLFGLWVIQSIVIWGVLWLENNLSLNDSMKLFVAKLIATGITLVWNYLLYSRVVFKKH